MKKLGKEAKFAIALSKRDITRKQAMAQFKLGNPSATVHRLTQKQDVTRTYVTKKVNGIKTRTVKYSFS